ncbi:hypothetical protein C2E15_12985 [Mixta gaviniae]|uniref:Uncharacterized protein n=1 Tax=Mixta gaviniae TaxID=665914 RepID=A0A1X1DVU1_9GAMM|nr:hypothetical protein C2E15_12985 [Mixta gaviniae]ORM80712.1 hypothetical protein HA44_10700 [Mixta gaviniae]
MALEGDVISRHFHIFPDARQSGHKKIPTWLGRDDRVVNEIRYTRKFLITATEYVNYSLR